MVPAVPQARCTQQRVSIDIPLFISLQSQPPLPLLDIILCHEAFFFQFPTGSNRSMIIIKREKDDQLSFVDLPVDLAGEMSALSQTQSIDLLSPIGRRIAKVASELRHLYSWWIEARKTSISFRSQSITAINYNSV